MPQRTHRKPYNSLEALSSTNADAVSFKLTIGDPSALWMVPEITSSTLWYKTKESTPKWATKYKISAIIGHHQFFRK